ncbi:CDP-diacylglycerol--serine O-phosphatidyltransferase [Candidatus Pantoea carbekii]|uniref:PssA protein n=1 Tax=Candidatus Pantoea carbekii TaxID=1235990 RepID=U3U9C8_9GAMM|nr:CDP-diacylglycerol--serine O-phosphatidyltransferase [Candidatus Pantoea carbekii]AKC31883.1 CDP-diacylglycerol--serine O-phosphatidyltransferase [Candidatus Pantoea carbekii]BAO00398.1 PssA protein [Candidatus Pantoea carbekii]
MLSKFNFHKHQKYLSQLPKISQSVDDINIFYSPTEFCEILLKKISTAQQRICITALYLENDRAGRRIMQALYVARQTHPKIDISIWVDWHRAQRKRIDIARGPTNANWYYKISSKYSDIAIPVYGIPVNTREALGVLHLKGIIIDDMLLYSGANINDMYLHLCDKYRYDRYHLIRNAYLTNIMYEWICKHLKRSDAVNRLDQFQQPDNLKFKKKVRLFRQYLQNVNYTFISNVGNKTLALTPLVGLGKNNIINKTILHLVLCTKYKIILCTPYFNPPAILVRKIIQVLRQGKKVEIIVGDKITNDFYIPADQKFKIISTLPYLYEINLRRFLSRLQYYISNHQLTVRIWKDCNNSYHLKGIWVDKTWMMITGNNLNPRAWRLDLENAVLIHDPLQELAKQREKELIIIRNNTTILKHFRELESICEYPEKVRKLIRRLRRISIDRLIKRLI